MNPNCNAKRNKNRSSTNSNPSMSSNVQRSIARNSMRNNYSNSINLRGDSNNMSSSSQNRNYSNKPVNTNSNPAVTNHITEVQCNGVYKNKRLFHSMMSLIGCLIEIQLEDGKRYEGILKTFSPEFELALCSAVIVVEDSSEKRNSGNNIGNLLAALKNKEEVTDTLVIDPKKLVTFKVLNVDLDYATKNAVMTDSEIAKNDGTKQHRELIPWEGDDGIDNCSETLDLGSGVSNGWTTEDMFKLNESRYNVGTAYQEDMSEYTIKLEHRNDEEYRQHEAQAAKIAREIEQDPARTARYAKEDDPDEESLFSAVIRDDSESSNNLSSNNNTNNNNNNNYNNNHSYRNEINSHSRDDRRDNVRNNSDNMGFRTQNSRQNRTRITNRGERTMGPNEPNWRESNNRMNANRFHQSSMAYNSKSNTSGNYGGPSGKYVNQSNQYSNTASQAKSSYSTVSARNASNEPNDTEPIKTFPNRNSSGHPNKDYPPPNIEDVYQRKPPGGGLPQRETYKQQRTPYSRVVEQQQQSESKSPSNKTQLESDVSKSSLPTSPSTPMEPLLKANTLSKTDSTVPSKLKPEESQSQQQTRITSPKNVTPESKKLEPIAQSTEVVKKNNNKPVIVSKEILQSESESRKIDSSSTIISSSTSSLSPSLTNTNIAIVANSSAPGSSSSSSSSSSSLVSTPIQTVTTTNTTTAPEVSPSTTTSSTDGIQSRLNPNAKVFVPRMIQQQNHAMTNYTYTGLLSTTPPSIPSAPLAPTPGGQFIQYTHPSGGGPHILGHPSHHHQQTQIRYINNNMQFQPFSPMIQQLQPLVPQYIAISSVPTFATSMPAGVAAPVTAAPSQSSGPPNVPNQSAGPPPSQMASHHMITNTSVSNQSGSQNNGAPQQVPPPQPNQAQQSRGPYRSGSKGPSNTNPTNPHNTIRQDFSQQNQVANVTGPPIMAGTTPNQPLSVVFPSSAAVHHNQNQIHGQQPQNMGQPTHNQPLPPYMYGFATAPRPLLQNHHSNTLNIAAIQPSLYSDSHMSVYCTEMPPQVVTAQSLAPMPQGNMQTSALPNGGQAPVPSSNSPTTQGSVPTSSQQPSF